MFYFIADCVALNENGDQIIGKRKRGRERVVVFDITINLEK